MVGNSCARIKKIHYGASKSTYFCFSTYLFYKRLGKINQLNLLNKLLEINAGYG